LSSYLLSLLFFFFFFFSSRRRHTRFSRDWSSDVCSSDLLVRLRFGAVRLEPKHHGRELPERRAARIRGAEHVGSLSERGAATQRSEERRVGKERRTRGRPDDLKKKDKK